MNDRFLTKKKIFAVSLVTLVIVLLLFVFLPPIRFPKSSMITVSPGESLYTLANDLKEKRVIRSPFWFRIFAITLGGERDMKAGDYYLSRRESSFKIAERIFNGDYGVETARITIPEGFTIKKISNLFDERFSLFDHELFETSADEGYLFPDTYFIQVTATASSTIKMLSDNFERRLRSLQSEIRDSERSLEEIITMASILEGEARGEEEMKIVAGILWSRFDSGMPLQVDTGFLYVNGKTTKDLTLEDLKIDSPYNTYLYRGLPPTPISNPGLIAIRAALYPEESSYVYFLTGDDGTMHYSKTFEEHVEKKRRYIKR